MQQKVYKEYKKKLPNITDMLRKCANEQVLNKLYGDIVEIWTDSRQVVYRPPERFKSFWNSNLDFAARRRKKLYKAAIRAQSPELWVMLRKYKIRIRRLVNKRKRAMCTRAFWKQRTRQQPFHS